jgi:hypothetical protein
MAAYELPPLLKKKLKKESVIFCFLLSIGTFFTILIGFGVHLPNPLDWIIAFIKPIANFIDYLFK